MFTIGGEGWLVRPRCRVSPWTGTAALLLIPRSVATENAADLGEFRRSWSLLVVGVGVCTRFSGHRAFDLGSTEPTSSFVER